MSENKSGRPITRQGFLEIGLVGATSIGMSAVGFQTGFWHYLKSTLDKYIPNNKGILTADKVVIYPKTGIFISPFRYFL